MLTSLPTFCRILKNVDLNHNCYSCKNPLSLKWKNKTKQKNPTYFHAQDNSVVFIVLTVRDHTRRWALFLMHFHSSKQIPFVLVKWAHNALNQEQNFAHIVGSLYRFLLNKIYPTVAERMNAFFVFSLYVKDIEPQTIFLIWCWIQSKIAIVSGSMKHANCSTYTYLKACYVFPATVRPLSSNIPCFSMLSEECELCSKTSEASAEKWQWNASCLFFFFFSFNLLPQLLQRLQDLGRTKMTCRLTVKTEHRGECEFDKCTAMGKAPAIVDCTHVSVL